MSTEPSNSIDAPSADRVGQLISGRYRICSLLGTGAMGAVYLAEHTHMKKRFALKLLHAEMANSEEVTARFQREAEAAAHVEHPNIVTATDFGQAEDGAFFLVLEYVDGILLRDKLGAGPFSTARALHVVRQIALALECAHEAGIVHRDLKPENVMLLTKGDDPEFVKVLDFGVARFDNASAKFLTQIGTVMGSPSYMAPEQAVGDRVGHRADLYSLGCVLYELLTGMRPFEGELVELLNHHVSSPIPPMSERAPGVVVPAAVESIVRKLLEKDANNRYPSARALIDALDQVASESGPDMPSTSPVNDPMSARRAGTVIVAPKASGRPDVSALLARLAPYRDKVATAVAPVLTQVNGLLARVEDGLKVSRRVLLVVLGVSGAFAFALVLVIAFAVHRWRSGSDEVDTKTLDAGRRASPEEIRAAAIRGPAALEELADAFPKDPAILRELAFAYDAAGRSSDAVRVVRLMAEADPKGVPTEVVRIATRAAATPETSDEAFRLLEGPLGSEGVDALIELAEGKNVTASTSVRAQRSLSKTTVRASASPAAAFLLDLGDASTCEEKHDLLLSSGNHADARALPSLRALESRYGCGRRRRNDCHSCLRTDRALERAIEAARSAPPQ